MLPATGPWPHPWHDLPDAFVDVALEDEQGHARRARARHKILGEGPNLVLVHGLMTSSSWQRTCIISGAFPCPTRILYARKDVMVPPELGPLFHADIPGSELVWMDDASHFLQVDAPERTVEQIVSFEGRGDRDGARAG